jgi:hypothetical protein
MKIEEKKRKKDEGNMDDDVREWKEGVLNDLVRLIMWFKDRCVN